MTIAIGNDHAATAYKNRLSEHIKEKGFDKWDDGHSGNSAGMSVLFASFLLFKRELFPYLHGALAPLVGDEGYHDDRADVELALKQLGVNPNE